MAPKEVKEVKLEIIKASEARAANNNRLIMLVREARKVKRVADLEDKKMNLVMLAQRPLTVFTI